MVNEDIFMRAYSGQEHGVMMNLSCHFLLISMVHQTECAKMPRLKRQLSFESNFLAAIEDQTDGHGLNIGCCMHTRAAVGSHGRVSREEFAKLWKERVTDRYPRYRSRIYSSPSLLGLDVHYNVEDLGEDFDVLSIVDEVKADDVLRERPQSMSAVETVVERIMTTPFDEHLPPIKFVLVQGEDGNTTIVSKLHHALADGFSSIMALLELTDPMPDTQLRGSANGVGDGSSRLSEDDVNSKTSRLASGLCILWQWLKLIPWAIYMLLVFSVLPDSYTSLHPTFSRRGRLEVRFGKEVSVEDLKVVSRATGAKINDVILALLAGAARRYLLAEAVKNGKEIGDPASLRMGFQFTANMRSMNDKPRIGGGGNESWVFSVPLSLHADVRERIRDAQLQTGRLKSSPAFLFGRVFIRFCGLFMNLPLFRPLLIQSICGGRYLLGKTLTVTNVRGPRNVRSVCGREIVGLQCYVSYPQTFTVVTYNGRMSTTICTDEATVDAELLRECYSTEIEQSIAFFRP